MIGEFNVFQFFRNDKMEEVASHVDAMTAVRTAKSLAESIGGQIGTTAEIIITDGDDYTTFHWRHGEGIVFPTGADIAALKTGVTPR